MKHYVSGKVFGTNAQASVVFESLEEATVAQSLLEKKGVLTDTKISTNSWGPISQGLLRHIGK